MGWRRRGRQRRVQPPGQPPRPSDQPTPPTTVLHRRITVPPGRCRRASSLAGRRVRSHHLCGMIPIPTRRRRRAGSATSVDAVKPEPKDMAMVGSRAEVVGGVLERLAFVVGVAAKAEAAPCGPPSRPRAGESSRSPSPTVCCPAVAGETRRTEVRRRDTIHAQGVMRSAPRQAMVGGRLPAHRQAAAAREQAHGQVEAGAPRLRAAHRGRGRQPAITT